jgi:hypothetical protein
MERLGSLLSNKFLPAQTLVLNIFNESEMLLWANAFKMISKACLRPILTILGVINPSGNTMCCCQIFPKTSFRADIPLKIRISLPLNTLSTPLTDFSDSFMK